MKAETEAVAGSAGKPSFKIKLGGKALTSAASQQTAGGASVKAEEKPAPGAAKKARKAKDTGEKPARRRPKKGRSPEEEEDADDVRPNPFCPLPPPAQEELTHTGTPPSMAACGSQWRATMTGGGWLRPGTGLGTEALMLCWGAAILCTCSACGGRASNWWATPARNLRMASAQYIPVGAEIVGIGADDLEEISDAEADGEYYKLGAEDEHFKDYASLALKPDHANRCGAGSHQQPLVGQLINHRVSCLARRLSDGG